MRIAVPLKSDRKTTAALAVAAAELHRPTDLGPTGLILSSVRGEAR